MAVLLSSCSTVSYVFDQGVGQWRLLNRARPIDEVLASPYTKERTKWAILRVQEAKKYAVEKIGLKATANYKKYVALDEPYVTYVVAAAQPLALESKTWHFPIVGEVPYLGFFSKAKAEAFAARLRASENPPLDVYLRGVEAFSSLGWFPDPLYSSMIEQATERDIYDVVIHESVHATVWVGDSVDFNESLANFVGMKGSLNFVAENRDARELQAARNEVEWQRLFAVFVQRQIERYRQTVKTAEQKQAFYAGLNSEWQKFYKASGVMAVAQRSPHFSEWNNATLLSYGNYYRDYSIFEKVLTACNGSLRRFIAWIQLDAKKGGLMNSAPLDRIAAMGSEACP